MQSNPVVTVIALCFNHERFVLEALESIRAQTFQDFELIVTDDASRDGSAGLIAQWLGEHRPDAHFIRHSSNAGLCPTLNEALARARGEYICMIATDDTWMPDRLERHVAAMAEQPDSVAVVYSDVAQMDEDGHPLPQNFIAHHRPGFVPPSGQIFATLADGNFIPAMGATIRRSALTAVGGYDERLSYEDYDMWLRLSARYDFVFCPGIVARYRIVSTSMVRTLFVRPTAHHSYTSYLIRRKWLDGALLSPTQRARWAEELWGAAYNLYFHGDPRAARALWMAFLHVRKPRTLLLAVASTLGLSRARLKRWSGQDMQTSR
jgi:glycosyltransferase involved in cell wall biosynthesis